MRLELKQEKAINEHLRDELKKLEARKDERLGELASELGNVKAINKRLEGELERAKNSIERQKEGINHLNDELDRKDKAIQNLMVSHQSSVISNQSEEMEKAQARVEELEKINIELENHINAIQDKLSHLESKGMAKHPLTDMIKRWKSISKNTRDWTKCNQLLQEIEQLIERI